jgi:FixJ family two-component response regulator
MSLHNDLDAPARQCVGRNAALSRIPMVSIIDDDGSVREATKALVRSLGYSALTFASAEEFLSSDQLDDTSCLITDVQMPGLSGIELQKRLIAQERPVPVIFITAYPDETTRSRVFDAGAVGFLIKPFSDESLIRCLDMALAHYSREDH